MAPTEAIAPVLVADGPITEGSRWPQVALTKVKIPISTRQAEIM